MALILMVDYPLNLSELMMRSSEKRIRLMLAVVMTILKTLVIFVFFLLSVSSLIFCIFFKTEISLKPSLTSLMKLSSSIASSILLLTNRKVLISCPYMIV